MSGGHYDYAYAKIELLASDILIDLAKHSSKRPDGYGGYVDALPKDILEHMHFLAFELQRIAEAAKDVEWLMSDDISYETLRSMPSFRLSESKRSQVGTSIDPVSLEWLDRTLSEWPKKQPGKGGSVPPSSPKHKLVARWNHWVVGKKIDPAVLYLACWKYQNTYFNNGNYIKALMNFLSPSAAMVPEWLDWAKAEAKRQGIKQKTQDETS